MTFADTAAQIEKNIYEKIDPKDKGALDRVVATGMKVMFSKETHKYMLETLDKEGDLSEKLAVGVADLVMMLYSQSKGTMPGQVIVPAATILLARAGEFIDKTDGGMDNAVFGAALKLMVAGIKSRFEKMGKGQQPEQSGQPAEPSQPAAQPAPAAGLIGQGV